MKDIMKKCLKSEQGLALPLALIMLVVGVIFAMFTLPLMIISLNYNRTVEANTMELYSADAGVEQAIWTIKQALDTGIPSPEMVLPEQEGEDGKITLDPLPANLEQDLLKDNMMEQVTTTVTNMGERIFKISSTATSNRQFTYVTDNVTGNPVPIPSTTTIDCYIYLWNLSNLIEGAITSNYDIKIENCIVNGKVYHDYIEDPPPGWGINYYPVRTLDNRLPPDYPIKKKQYYWPEFSVLWNTYYDEDMPVFEGGDTYTVQTGELNGFYWGNPYTDQTLQIMNNDSDNVEVILNGNLCIDGTLQFFGPQSFILDLNGKTIIARQGISCQSGRLTIRGTGAIISGGDLDFNPSIITDQITNPEGTFILMMSVDGVAKVQPSSSTGDVYTCVLGGKLVEVKNSNIIYMERDDEWMNFPDDRPMVMSYEIHKR